VELQMKNEKTEGEESAPETLLPISSGRIS